MADVDISGGRGKKLGFIFWGVRYVEALMMMAYPTMGAAMAIDGFTWPVVLRLAVFGFFGVIFNVHIYIYNDWCGGLMNEDEPNQRKWHALKHSTLSERQVLYVSIVLAAVSLFGFALLSWRFALTGASIIAATTLYSHPAVNFKGKPVLGTIVHFVGASLYFLGGWSVFKEFTPESFALAAFFGLVLSAGHFSNEIEDFDQDMAAGMTTNAIHFGKRRVFMTGIFLFILSSIYFLAYSIVTFESHAEAGRAAPMYVLIGALLLAVWIERAYYYRAWNGNDDIAGFRNFYRLLYAGFCASLLAIRAAEWLLVPLFARALDGAFPAV